MLHILQILGLTKHQTKRPKIISLQNTWLKYSINYTAIETTKKLGITYGVGGSKFACLHREST